MKYALFFIYLFSITMFSFSAPTDDIAPLLTNDELDWLIENPEIKIGARNQWAPYGYNDSSGNYAGFGREYIDLIASKLGLEVEYVINPLQKNLALANSQEIDVIPILAQIPEREEYLDFSSSIGSFASHIFVHVSSADIKKMDDFNGKKIGVQKSAGYIPRLIENYPNIEFVEINNYREGLGKVKSKAIDGFISDLHATNYYLKEFYIFGVVPTIPAPVSSDEIRIAVRENAKPLLSMINKVIDSMSDADHQEIIDRFSFSSNINNQTFSLDLTEEEKQFLADHPIIRVSNEDDYPPFDFSENGEPRGLSIDYMRLIEDRLGVTFEFVNSYSWNELLQLAKNREIDVMQTIVKTQDREEFLLFVEPFYDTPTVIAVRENIEDIKQFEDLFGKRVAIVKGYFYENIILDQYPDIEIVLVENMAEALKKVSFGEVEATIEVPGIMNYEIRNNFLNNIKIVGDVNRDEFHNKLSIGVRNDWPLLHSAIRKAQQSITMEETTPIWNRWISYIPETEDKTGQPSISLSLQEQQWLNEHPTIRYTGDPNWLPFEAFTEEGDYIGIVAEHITLIENRLGITFEKIQTDSWVESIKLAQNGEIDVISDDTASQSLVQSHKGSDPYLFSPIVVLMHEHDEYITDLYQIQNQSIAVIDGYGYVSKIRQEYPELTFQDVETVEEGILMVSTGQVDAFLCTLTLSSYMLGELGIHNVKIVGQTNITSDLGFAIRKDWEPLLQILNKAIQSITPEERRTILNRWGRHEAIIERIDYELITQIAIIFFVILLFILIWGWRLRREISLRKQIENDLATSEEKAWSLLESTPDGIVVVDQQGDIIMVNNQAVTLFGYEKNELIRQPIEMLLPESLHLQHVSHVKSFFRNPDTRQMGGDRHLVAVRKNGSEFPVDVSLSLVEGDEPRVTAAIRDITDRKNRENLVLLNSKVGEILTKSDNLLECLQACANAMVEHLDASLVRFWILDSSIDMLKMTASAGLYTHIDGAHSWVKIGDKKVGAIAKKGVSYISNDIANDPLIDDQKWARDNKLIGFAGIPLKVGDRLVGMMVKFAVHEILPYRLRTLESIAQSIAIAIDRNQSQQKLHESQERLDLALKTSGIGIWDWDLKTDDFVFDKTLKGIIELDGSDPKANRQDFLNLIHPLDIDRLEHAIHDAIENNKEYEVEFRILMADDSIRHLSSNRKVFRDDNGSPVRLIGVCRDVTEKRKVEEQIKESQQFLQGLIDNSTALVYAKSIDGKYTLVNKKWCELFNIKNEDVIGKTDHEIFPLEEADEFRRNDLQVIETGEPIQSEESVTINGVQQTYMSLKFAIIDSQGLPTAVCGMSSDISDMKNLQNELQSKFDELERFRKIAVGRELKMVELKQEINDNLARVGYEKKYKIVNEDNQNLVSTK